MTTVQRGDFGEALDPQTRCARGQQSEAALLSTAGEGATMWSTTGLELLKQKRQSMDQSEEKLFRITQWNYVAFSAMALLSSSGFFVERILTSGVVLVVVCLIVSISLAASVLALYYYKWHMVEADAQWAIEKGVMRNTRAADVLAKLRSSGHMEVVKDANRIVGQLGRRTGYRSPFVIVNLIPALAGLIIAVLYFVTVGPPPEAPRKAASETARPSP